MTGAGDRPERRAPEGANCGEHPERPALATCPHCGGHVCIECWHPPVDRCHTCLQRDPSAAAPPVPWEQPGVGLGRRLLDTLVTVLQPVRTAPSFGRAQLAPAVRFALAVTLPLAFVRGIIPFTHTVKFGPSFALVPLGSPSTGAIVADVGRAMGISTIFTGALLLALAVPFVTLVRSYGSPLAVPAAIRVLLYRSWLVPASSQTMFIPGLLFGLVGWGLPQDANSSLVGAVFIIDSTLPLLLLLASMRSAARLAAGVGPFASFLVVGVPLVVLLLAQGMLVSIAGPWIPTPQGGAETQIVEAATLGAP